MPPVRHPSSSPPGQSLPKVRQRSRRACEPCRKRKIKCDGMEPCAACVGYDYDCVFKQRQIPPPHSEQAANLVLQGSNINTTPSSGAKPSVRDPPVISESVDGPCLAAETFVPPEGGRLIHESIKTRYTSASSAIAFPKILGTSLGLVDPPRLHSFGWNPGKRLEQNFLSQISICDIISADEMRKYAEIYFIELHPFFGFIDKALFFSRSANFWAARNHGSDFEALMCGVFGLGSYFSGSDASPAEARVVEQGRLLLDLSTAHPPALLSVKHVAAWILRTIYLRCTTRPHLSWIASCTAVHVAEAIGLHREISEQNMTRDMPRLVTSLEKELRLRTFWVALGINHFFAAEYGRSRVQLDLVDCKPLVPQDGDLTTRTLAILQSIPGSRMSEGTISDFTVALNNLAIMSIDSPFLGLLRADACFSIFRMLQASHFGINATQIEMILEITRVALNGVTFLRTMDKPWWNVVGTPFHSVCVLLSISTPESFAMIPSSLESLKNVVATYESHLSNEALKTAFTLVRSARSKKSKELDDLDRGLNVLGDISQGFGSQASSSIGLECELDYGMAFPDFLDLENFMGVTSQTLEF
ncbi:hypothetical protein B0J14DRAFT_312675 [Halenospora varia]|nr:hypothetical protein B0J14DRAFT_312675 [Halenospora varia]